MKHLKTHVKEDIQAGILVAVMFIPQSMAYAMLAGVKPIYGLYAGVIPLLTYILFCSSKHLSVGPVSVVSLLSFSALSTLTEPGSTQYLSYMFLLSFLIGGIQLIAGNIKIGKFVQYMQPEVIKGFISAVAFIIIINQLKNLTGIPLSDHTYIHQLILELIQNINKINIFTITIGLCSILFIMIVKRKWANFPSQLVIVLMSALLVHFFELDTMGVHIVGNIPQGLPSITIPSLNFEAIRYLLPFAVTIAFISYMESITVGQTIADKAEYSINPNQELKSLGMANIAGAWFSSIPVAGAFSRTAVNFYAGAKSKLSSLVTVLVICLTLIFLTPYFYFLPYSALAAIIITAVTGLINLNIKDKKIDKKVVFTLTFTITLFYDVVLGLLVGMFFSIFISLIKLYLNSYLIFRPKRK